MRLSDYIKDIGQSNFARIYRVSVVAAHSYQHYNRVVKPEIAYRIVKETKGLVSYEDIYNAHFDRKTKRTKKSKSSN